MGGIFIYCVVFSLIFYLTHCYVSLLYQYFIALVEFLILFKEMFFCLQYAAVENDTEFSILI